MTDIRITKYSIQYEGQISVLYTHLSSIKSNQKKSQVTSYQLLNIQIYMGNKQVKQQRVLYAISKIENRKLSLYCDSISDSQLEDAFKNLTQSPENKNPFSNITALCLGSNIIGNQGVRCIANGGLSNLQNLDLVQNRIGNKGLRYLAFENLKALHLNCNYFGNQGVKYLQLGPFYNLMILNLGGNQVGDEGAKHLANGHFEKVGQLDLQETYVCSGGGLSYLINHSEACNCFTLNTTGFLNKIEK